MAFIWAGIHFWFISPFLRICPEARRKCCNSFFFTGKSFFSKIFIWFKTGNEGGLFDLLAEMGLYIKEDKKYSGKKVVKIRRKGSHHSSYLHQFLWLDAFESSKNETGLKLNFGINFMHFKETLYSALPAPLFSSFPPLYLLASVPTSQNVKKSNISKNEFTS